MGRASHQEIVGQLLESKAVDFDAIGAFVAKSGPSLAMSDEPWENFCLTMRGFIRFYRFPFPGGPIEDLGQLGGEAGFVTAETT